MTSPQERRAMADPRCETCRFRSERNRCHRLPPQRGFWALLVNGFGAPNSEFPHVSPNDWCGEWDTRNAE